MVRVDGGRTLRELMEEVSQVVGGGEEVLNGWKTTQKVRKAVRKLLGVTFGRRKEGRKTW